MKTKILFILFMMLTVFSFAEAKKNSLKDYFDNNEYYIEKYNLDFGEIYYSYQFQENSDRYVKKAIFYILKDNEIFPLLKFDSKSVYNCSGKIMDCVIANHEFYGWELRFYEDDGYVSADFYTNNGRNVADTLCFKLNRNTMVYNLNKIDPSEY